MDYRARKYFYIKYVWLMGHCCYMCYSRFVTQVNLQISWKFLVNLQISCFTQEIYKFIENSRKFVNLLKKVVRKFTNLLKHFDGPLQEVLFDRCTHTFFSWQNLMFKNLVMFFVLIIQTKCIIYVHILKLFRCAKFLVTWQYIQSLYKECSQNHKIC
jgi:hypothetical protein